MNEKEMIECALEEGFASAAIVDTTDIIFDPIFRPYCVENLCGQYGVNYSCPPDCGSPEEMKQKIQAHKKAIVLQTIWSVGETPDANIYKMTKKEHNAAELRFVKRVREQGHKGIIVGSSGCALCSPCAITANEPCRFPDLKYSCMSAYCIYVRKLAERCGMVYDCGKGQVAFFGMYTFD